MAKTPLPQPLRLSIKLRHLRNVAIFTIGVLGFLGVLLFAGTQIYLRGARETTFVNDRTSEVKNPAKEPFPIGVYPLQKSIVENPDVDSFFGNEIGSETLAFAQHSWLSNAVSRLSHMAWYQNIASPTGRILIIQPGERKEQVASNFSKILHWNQEQKSLFLDMVASATPAVSDGTLMPATYISAKDAEPTVIAQDVITNFEDDVQARYPRELEKQVPLHDTLTIASLLQREAYDFEDMRQISGVIWNRLFVGMNLQLDASLQYAKANQGGNAWWPRVVPKDKYIESPYNTYKYKGLPPDPIANVSLDAILAALNPKKTDCMYYFHDRKGRFYCSVTYEEHVTSLKKVYGRGK